MVQQFPVSMVILLYLRCGSSVPSMGNISVFEMWFISSHIVVEMWFISSQEGHIIVVEMWFISSQEGHIIVVEMWCISSQEKEYYCGRDVVHQFPGEGILLWLRCGSSVPKR